jgi:hypothetical protein
MRGKAYLKEWAMAILCPTYKNKGNLISLTVIEEQPFFQYVGC